MHSSYRYGLSPPRENASLKTHDIPGARPYPKFSKNSDHYHQRLYHQDYPYDNQPINKNEYPTTLVGDIRASQTINNSSSGQIQSYRARSVSRERISPLRRNSILDIVHNGPNPYERYVGKKHYYEKLAEPNEIQRENVFVHKEVLNPQLTSFDYPRNLSTQDIPGAIPGTLISKVVKNHEIASKIRQSQHIQADSLDHFQKGYLRPKDPLDEPYWRDHESRSNDFSVGGIRRSLDQPAYLSRHQVNEQSALGLENLDSRPIDTNRPDRLNNAADDYLQKLRASSVIKNPENSSSPSASKIQNSYNEGSHNYQGNYNVEEHYKNPSASEEDRRYSKKEDNYENYSPEPIPQKPYPGNLSERNSIEPSKNIESNPTSTELQLQQNFSKYYGDQVVEKAPEKAQLNGSQNSALDIMQKERMINQQHQQMKKIYSYNIIANQPQYKLAPPGTRYTNTMKNSYSFETNILEPKFAQPGTNLDNKIDTKGYSLGNQSYQNSSHLQQGLSHRSGVYGSTELSKRSSDDNQYAGKLNDYGETKNPYLQQADALPDKNYSGKALKNISGMRLY